MTPPKSNSSPRSEARGGLEYLHDKRALIFNGLATQVNPLRTKQGEEYISKISFWRAPYLASFRSGNFDFVVLTTHIRWGDNLETRRAELQQLDDWIEAKRKSEFAEDRDLILMGDFNIPTANDALFKAITSRSLEIPKGLRGLAHGSNLEKNKRYDQILHYPQFPENFTNKGGVLDYFIDQSHVAELFPGGLTRAKFTYQISDHLPLWMQIQTDIDSFQLEQIVRG